MIRSTTDEMLAARFDKEPWEDEAGRRFAVNPDPSGDGYLRYRPRPEFIPSRDPLPFVNTHSGNRYPDTEAALYFAEAAPGLCWFDPRPEYARPEPNPILAAFRSARFQGRGNAEEWLRGIQYANQYPDYTPAQIEHARKVLTRLAALKAVA